jgi:YidC/Oxa1 family membrane protein insertase
MQEIRRNYRGEEQAARILDLYKREGVHPLYSLKSLAGVAVVLPIFIGAFDMLAENIWLSGESFLWISDLSRPDAVARLPLPVLFLGDRLNVLPFLMTGLSVWASWLHQHEALSAAQQRQQVQKLSLMAVAFFVLFYTFPSGMVLYWTTNNLISVARNLYNRYRASPTDSPDTQ